MQRIKMLLQKINEIAHKGDNASLIEIDLMMDYTRVLYADMADMRSRLVFREDVPGIPATPQKAEEPQPVTIHSEPEQVQEVPFTTAVSQAVKKETLVIPATDIQNNKASIELLIGINDKYQFISELFNNNKELYETTIREIGDFESYQQATDWLATNFTWNSEDAVVESFYSIIDRHYNQQ